MTDPFSVTTSAIGVVSLGLTVCQGLLKYYSSWKWSHKDVAATCASLEALSNTLRLIDITVQDSKFTQTIVDRVVESTNLCDTTINELTKKLVKVKKTTTNGLEDQIRNQYSRAVYPLKESTLLKIRETVFDLRDSLTLAIGSLQL